MNKLLEEIQWTLVLIQVAFECAKEKNEMK